MLSSNNGGRSRIGYSVRSSCAKDVLATHSTGHAGHNAPEPSDHRTLGIVWLEGDIVMTKEMSRDTTVLEDMVINLERKKTRAMVMQERHHQDGNRDAEILWLKETERLDNLINKAKAIIKRNK